MTSTAKNDKDKTYDYEVVAGASYQCLTCNKVHSKTYDPPLRWKKFDEERAKGLFICSECNVSCEAYCSILRNRGTKCPRY